MSLYRLLRFALPLVGLLGASSTGHAVPISTTDAAQVAAFQSGATVLGFDELAPNTVGGSLQGNTGAPIQAASQLSAQYAAQGVVFSSSGGPLGVISVEGLSNQADAKSPFNVIGGSVLSGGIPVLNYFSPITLVFNALTSKVGAWNDPTGSNVTLSAYNLAGDLIESVTGDQGLFLGIAADGIARAVFTYNVTQGAQGFSLDDVTFVAVPPVSPVPLPASALLLLTGLIGLKGARRRMTRAAI
jgi:hypothetical protein